MARQLDRDQEMSPTKNKTTAAADLSEGMVKELVEHLERNIRVGADHPARLFSLPPGATVRFITQTGGHRSGCLRATRRASPISGSITPPRKRHHPAR